jgi:hypothetical protein
LSLCAPAESIEKPAFGAHDGGSLANCKYLPDGML